jgi:hypothetical protein
MPDVAGCAWTLSPSTPVLVLRAQGGGVSKKSLGGHLDGVEVVVGRVAFVVEELAVSGSRIGAPIAGIAYPSGDIDTSRSDNGMVGGEVGVPSACVGQAST